MKRLLLAVAISLVAGTVHAEHRLNPDRYASLGLDLIKGQAAGIPRAGVNDTQTNGGLAGFKADFRLPVKDYLSLHAAAEATGINNNLQYTDGYRLEMGFRMFFLPD